jgi:hypothetical protein
MVESVLACGEGCNTALLMKSPPRLQSAILIGLEIEIGIETGIGSHSMVGAMAPDHDEGVLNR